MVLIRVDGPPLCRHAPLKCELKSLIDGHSYWESGSRKEWLNRDEDISTASAGPVWEQPFFFFF